MLQIYDDLDRLTSAEENTELRAQLEKLRGQRMAKENPKEAAGSVKLPLHLNPPIASRFQALAQKDGADKYGAWNWREAGIYLTTYIGAAKRHLDAIERGEWLDPKSGLPHFAHLMAGAAISLDAWWYGKLTDDRPPGQTNLLPPPGDENDG